ncbi:MAG: tetratricopeptide repeat protein [Gammaproteobacteria bacterium]|nr:MAG: tetratricopeptide repeat protein [Gammaproteobacteria bacterium]
MKKLLAVTLLAVVLASCTPTNTKPDVSTVEAEKHLNKGIDFASAGSLKKALTEFDQVIDICNKKYSDKKLKVFSSRGSVETLYYMALAATQGVDAMAVDTTCSDALYFRGYSELDLGNIALAQTYIERAIEMSPNNSVYLSELGHIHQTNKKWNEALATFTDSEDSAELYSPEQVKVGELTRAKRGVGYALIELQRFDEAELKYQECLKLDPSDKGSVNELEYIKSLREKSSK